VISAIPAPIQRCGHVGSVSIFVVVRPWGCRPHGCTTAEMTRRRHTSDATYSTIFSGCS
jgi:hypothetical protein